MIARIWTGEVTPEKASAYLELMEQVSIPDYRAINGNRGAWCLHRPGKNCVEVTMLSFWTDLAAICRFAGEDATKAFYYDFDDDFLLAKAERVTHYELIGAPEQ